jgi:hypothetical protein
MIINHSNSLTLSFKPTFKDFFDKKIEEAKSEDEEETLSPAVFTSKDKSTLVDIKKAEEIYFTAKYACRMIMNLINDMLD